MTISAGCLPYVLRTHGAPTKETVIAKHRRRGPPDESDGPVPRLHSGPGAGPPTTTLTDPSGAPDDGSADAPGCRTPPPPTRGAGNGIPGRLAKILAYIGVRMTVGEIVEEFRDDLSI